MTGPTKGKFMLRLNPKYIPSKVLSMVQRTKDTGFDEVPIMEQSVNCIHSDYESFDD